jgi:predicted regulator of Ras-like GTPase activity (Roadblock/LC7/MglB family)
VQTLPAQLAALQQLSEVPGVVGSLVFGAGGDVLASQFPPVFDGAGLDQLARQLAADGYFQEWLSTEDGALELRFGDGTALVRTVDGSWLLVLCTTQANPQLLSMSLTQVVRRLRMAPARRAGPAAAPPAASAPTPSRLDLLRGVVQVELGPQAAQALELLATAGESPKDLRRAADDIEKLTKLFISTKKAGELARKMKDILGG